MPGAEITDEFGGWGVMVTNKLKYRARSDSIGHMQDAVGVPSGGEVEARKAS